MKPTDRLTDHAISRKCDTNREGASAAELAEASVLVLLPEAKEGPKLPFGGGGGGC